MPASSPSAASSTPTPTLYAPSASHSIGLVEPNPYQPPANVPAPPPANGPVPPPAQAPTYELYAPNHVVLAGFLGTPMAGCWLLSLNYRRQGRESQATRMLLAGVGV